MLDIQHERGDSRSNEGKALSVLATREGFAIVPLSTGRDGVVWTSLGPLPRWVPGPTTRWAPGTTRLALHGT
jgi:hypothetical protein